MNAVLVDAFAWLLLPLSGSSTHEVSAWVSWHGRVMVFSWGLLLPLGVLAARFFKVMPGQDWPQVMDNQRWWKAHLHGQSWAVALGVVGVALVWGHASGATPAAQLHGVLGWSVMALGLVQVASGLARGSKGGPAESTLRGDHYDMTPWRKTFERLHKALGYTALLVAMTVLVLGLTVADAPRWMVLGLVVWCWILLAAFAVLQRQGRCIDTYQAIWGPDSRHPGSQSKPIGCGIRRYTAASFAKRFRFKAFR